MTLKWRLEDPLRGAKDAHLSATPTPTSAVPGVSLRLSAASRSKFRDPDAESAYRNLPLVLAGVLASRDSPTPLTFFHAFETIVKHWTVKMPEFRAPKIFPNPTEEAHEYDPRKLPSGSAHGSGRLGAGTCRWSKGTEFKPQRQYLAVRNDASFARAGGGWRHLVPARRGRAFR